MRTERRVSAGGVLWRPREPEAAAGPSGAAAGPSGAAAGEPERAYDFCLIRTGPARWQLPKGTGQGSETLAETARREIREETGCDGEIEGTLGQADFWFVDRFGAEPVRAHKFVHFFLVRFVSGSTDAHDDEAEEARWMPAERAITALTFENERVVARAALARLRTGGAERDALPQVRVSVSEPDDGAAAGRGDPERAADGGEGAGGGVRVRGTEL